jgi:hypothetical protein
LLIISPSALAQVIEEKTAPIKEALMREAALEAISSSSPSSDWALAEKAREFGSCTAHEILDGLAALGEAAPQLLSEIGEVSSRLFPEIATLPSFSDTPIDPMGNYNGLVQNLHEKIDEVFNTAQAASYSPEGREFDATGNFTVGILPPPGMVRAFTGDLKQLAAAGKVLDRRGLTRAGRGLAKHGNRSDTVFPKAYGNPDQVNTQGQAALERILNHPEKVITVKINERYGALLHNSLQAA